MGKRTNLAGRLVLTALLLHAAAISYGVRYHEFYVSLSELRYNPSSGHLELSIRLFPDDVDVALEAEYGTKTRLVTSLEAPCADSLLRSYLDRHLRIVADGRPVSLNFLGKEAEGEAMWCYLESGDLRKPETLEVRCTLLSEQFEDQVHIVQLYVGDWNRGMLLSRDHPGERIRVGS